MITTVPSGRRGMVVPQLALGGIEPRTSLLLVQVFASEPLLSDILLAVRRSLVLNYVLIACLWISLQTALVYPGPAEAGFLINQGIKPCLTMRQVSVRCTLLVLSVPMVPVFVLSYKTDPGF